MTESCCAKNSCCCSGGTEHVPVPVVSTSLSFKDVLGSLAVRSNISRMDYRVKPGLYAVGTPNSDSPVLVSANYKLTFDTLRKNLAGLDCWLLTLDTKGVNVWCAAGKGTFGTDELVNRIEMVGLSEIITHKKLMVPQLGASGVCAHEVTRRTGFSVIFGPVRASDIQAFIAAGYQATKEMRTVKFTFWDRLVLTPIELIEAAKKSLIIFGVLFLMNFILAHPFDAYDVAAYAGAVIVGTVFIPVLLPFIPGKAFSWKGWILGLCWTVFVLWLFRWYAEDTLVLAAGYLLLLPAVSAYLALNFTGCSTFTSPSGVLKEMKAALPLIVSASIIGAVLVLVYKLFL